MKQYIVTGMSCAACQARVEKAVSGVPGVTAVSVSLLTNSMGVEGTAAPEEIIRAVEKSVKNGDRRNTAADSPFAAEEDALRDRETPKLRKRLILSAAFLLALMYITMGFNMWGWPLPAYFTHNHLALALTQMILAAAVMIVNRKFFTSRQRMLTSASLIMSVRAAMSLRFSGSISMICMSARPERYSFILSPVVPWALPFPSAGACMSSIRCAE